MKLIVGLGNPGRKYEGTRHNIGFEVVRELAKRFATGRTRTKFQGETCEAKIGLESALLLMPQTFMNRSGSSVLPARDFYKLDAGDILVICDDFHLPLARLRIRPDGSAGGQKGLADILVRLGTLAVPRLRFGVGAAPPDWDVADYVLSKFRNDEWDAVDVAVGRSTDAVVIWASQGIQECMNKYNASPEAQKKTQKKKKTPNQKKPSDKSNQQASDESSDSALDRNDHPDAQE